MGQIEKLIGLLDEAEYATRHVKPGFKNMYVAQHLVQNGVRVQSEREAEKGFSKEQLTEMFEKLVNSCEVSDRVAAASVGYGLEHLVYDDDAEVRKAIARQGACTDILVTDPDEMVRATLARNGHCVDELMHDKSIWVREAVALSGNHLDVLVHDESDSVRGAVAWRRYGLDKLIDDSSTYVIGRVKNILFDEKMSIEEWMLANPERCALSENRKARLDDVIHACEGVKKKNSKSAVDRDFEDR